MSQDERPRATEPVPGIRRRTKAELEVAIHQHRRAVLVVNTRSRRGRRAYTHLYERLRAGRFDLLGSFRVDHPWQLAAGLRAAVAAGPDLVIAGGGDGTIGAAARHVAYRDMALGVLPLGTTNNFARSLGIPVDLATAVSMLSAGAVADVDLGRAGDATFANQVSVGLSSHVVADTPVWLKRLVGRAAYPVIAALRLPGHRPFHARIRTDATARHLHTHQLIIANASFHAGRPITGDASPDDQLLVIYQLGGARRRQLVAATIGQQLAGGRRTLTAAPYLAADEVWLYTDPPLPLDIDGEVTGQTPVHITVAPDALRVMAPPNYSRPMRAASLPDLSA